MSLLLVIPALMLSFWAGISLYFLLNPQKETKIIPTILVGLSSTIGAISLYVHAFGGLS